MSLDWTQKVFKTAFKTFQWDLNNFTKSLSTINLGRDIRANDISVSDKSTGQLTVSTSSGNVVMLDVRQTAPVLTLNHGGDVLTHDVSKFDADVVVSAGTGRSILCWDLRNGRRPVVVLNGHSHPVRKVVTSFHSPLEFASASYDFSVRYRTVSADFSVRD